MSDEEKMMIMFTAVHGDMTGSCYAEVELHEDTSMPIAIHCMKDGNICWTATKLDILFDYMTKDWK
jgi:hypothetical protein